MVGHGHGSHLLRDDMVSQGYYSEPETCTAPERSSTDQLLLPVTLVSSLVLCVILVIDVTLRLRKKHKDVGSHGDGRQRRRSGSVMTDYSIDDFESLDMGTVNMLFHLQDECNDVSAKIDRCAMALVTSNEGLAEGEMHKTDINELGDILPSKEEMLSQWENLRWFQEFVCLHMTNAFHYQAYHAKLEGSARSLDQVFGTLHGLLKMKKVDNHESMVSKMMECLEGLHEATRKLSKLVPQSTKVVPLHRRVKFTGRQEALPVRALCDYSKDGFSIRFGEPLMLIWRKNKYTWRVRTSQNVEGYLPALCCLIPGPDPDTMEHAQCLADDFLRQWQAYYKRLEKALCLCICQALSAASLKESPLVTIPDTSRAKARDTLSLVERVMTSEQFPHVISEGDRKLSQSVVHQLYELLNGNHSREETLCFLKTLKVSFDAIKALQQELDLVKAVSEQTQKLTGFITQEKGRKRSLTKHTNISEVSGSSSPMDRKLPELEVKANITMENDNPADADRTSKCLENTTEPENLKHQNSSYKDTEPQTLPKGLSWPEPALPINEQPDVNNHPAARPTICGFDRPSHGERRHETPEKDPGKQQEQPTETSYRKGAVGSPPSENRTNSEVIAKRKRQVVSNTSDANKPQTPIIQQHHAPISKNACFGSPYIPPSTDQSLNSRTLSPTGRRTDDEKLSRGQLQRSASVGSDISVNSQGSRESLSSLRSAQGQNFNVGSRPSIARRSTSRRTNSRPMGSFPSNPENIGAGNVSSLSKSNLVEGVKDPANPSGSFTMEHGQRPRRPSSLKPISQQPMVSDEGYSDTVSEKCPRSSSSVTPQSPMSSDSFYSCASTPMSPNSDVSNDVSLSISLSSDEDLDDPLTTTSLQQEQQSSVPNSISVWPDQPKVLPTITILWQDDKHTSPSSFVAFKKDPKKEFSISAIRHPETDEVISVEESIRAGILDVDKGLLQARKEAGKETKWVSLSESIWNGRVLLQATQKTSTSSTKVSGITLTEANVEESTVSSGADAPELPNDQEIPTSLPLIGNRFQLKEEGKGPTSVSLMKIILKRSSQTYIIRKVVDPRNQLIIPIENALREGILDQESKHYRNPTTGHQITMNDAFARGLLIVDYNKAFDETQDECGNVMVYKGQEGVIFSRLIAVFWVKDEVNKKALHLFEAIQKGLIHVNKGVYKLEDRELSLSEAVMKGYIKASVLDNSDIESLIRRALKSPHGWK